MSNMNEVHTFPSYFFNIHFNSILNACHYIFQAASFPSVVRVQILYILLSSHASQIPALSIFLYFIIRILVAKEYKLLSSSLCTFIIRPIVTVKQQVLARDQLELLARDQLRAAAPPPQHSTTQRNRLLAGYFCFVQLPTET
jgi:hypothetical protein